MRVFILITAGIFLASFGLLGMAQPQSQPVASCSVPANYYEAVNENNLTLLKVLGMVNSPSSPLDEINTAYLYYATLISVRHYHEDIRPNLPDCAQELNLVTIETISASQDAVAMLIAQRSNPEQRRYESRLKQAVDHLNETWQVLGPLSSQTGLVSDEG